ncbi:MAG: histone deacetylase [Calditrichaeota bacterium]|nr:MAG: histone deacetylase [Calditrichota bacterium]MBL1205306.1 histone deacetylase [Calditrichota bacterium]NOG45135.1 histone deacetylase [Calditrichota bacterium]
MNTIGYISDPIFLEHNPGEFHPERADRLRAIESHLKKSGIWTRLSHFSPPPATKNQLCLAHNKNLVEYNLAQNGIENFVIDGDTILSEQSISAALKAVGAGIHAVDLVFKEKSHSRIFTAVRPPGHHAEKNRSMGFCIFNNIAIAAAYAIEKKYIKSALIIDWDVHHGNGTQDIFYNRDDVFYLSLHQSPLFPGTGFSNETGADEGVGYTLNIPLDSSQDDGTYCKILSDALSKIGKVFSPDLVFISAGFDAHVSDPIGGMNVSSDGFAQMTKIITAFANDHCDGKIISMLEGGYDLNGLAESVTEHLMVLNQ